jgi:glutamate N-acetyltransferase/amino-acid N-acetyltransferase
VWVAESGNARPYAEADAHHAVTEDPVLIRIDLNAGGARGWIWTSDLTRDYIDINAHYRS